MKKTTIGETVKNKDLLIQMTEIATVVKLMKKDLEDIKIKNDVVHDGFLNGEGKIKNNRDSIIRLDKDINGNGKPGLKNSLEKMERKMAYYAGIVFILGVIAPIIVTIVIKQIGG